MNRLFRPLYSYLNEGRDAVLAPATLRALTLDHRRVDRAMLGVVFLHALVGVTLAPYAYGYYLQDALVGATLVAVTLAAYAAAKTTPVFRVTVGFVLGAFAALYIQQMQGMIELHFQFFIILPILAVYKDLWAVWACVAITVLHHTLFNYCQFNGVRVFGADLYVFRTDFGWGIVLLHTAFVALLSVILSYEILLRRRRFLIDADLRETLDAISKTRSLSSYRMSVAGAFSQRVNAWLDEVAGMASEIESARAKAEESSRLKSEFLTNMSHEIRTPMNAILGYAQLLRRDASLTKRQLEKVEPINRAGEHLLSLINDILEMSKIEAGKITVHETTFDLPAMIKDLEELYGPRASAKGLDFRVVSGASLPAAIRSDETKLRQVLVNLLGNAMKFTPNGSVCLEISTAEAHPGDSPDTVRLNFLVCDTGPGVGAGERERLFKPFVQSSAGLAVGGGTGLGLAIARHYARLLGGDVTLESEPGEGARFRLTAPVGRVNGVAPGWRSSARHIGRLKSGAPPVRILVADDMPMNRELLESFLKPVGFEVRLVENGAQAVEQAEVWRPHAVLMDMRMPVMDGYEATRRIKSTPAGQSMLVIALTASAFEEDKSTVLDAGADGFMSKPFRLESLLTLLGEKLSLEYEQPDGDGENLTLEVHAIAGLPEGVRVELRHAAHAADFDRLMEICDELASAHPRAAAGIRQLTEAYDYPTLESLSGPGVG